MTEITLWPFREAQRIMDANTTGKHQGPIRFQTGYGPSSLPHIGTFAEDWIRKAYSDRTGHTTELIVFSDDMDGLRKVPTNVPNQDLLEKSINLPLSSVPDPFGTHPSFAHHNN